MIDMVLGREWPVVPAALDLTVEGADGRSLSESEVRRLFPGSANGARLNRLRNWPRVVVRADDVLLGVATYTQTPIETQVPDFAVDVPPSPGVDRAALAAEVLDTLLGAIEIASMAGGCRRVVLIPSRTAAEFERRGYVCVNEGCGGSWVEKSIL